jgi:endonuclease-3
VSAGRLTPAESAEAFRRLETRMPGRTATAKGPKDQPDPFRSVVACMLSAQSRDANTALATERLFAQADTPDALLDLGEAAIAAAIKPCGLYNMKAKNIVRLCRDLVDRLDRKVPETRDGLMALPGVGRKCADIVLSFTFGQDVIAVDTHVFRVANRLGLTEARTADETARQLEQDAPDFARRDGHFWLIQFGKAVCTARRPQCEGCFLADLCRWFAATRGDGEPVQNLSG